ncbi:MAG: hypothetical protein EKK63_02405 [Acinetobacter sp.]|uniref:hypothetical protein n=1 Tax=Acinetobacter sp. TaxID=472 RepID=UPI000F909C8F|nr:hypothetical protein [Acinetobacter sp.]RUP42169.1 MAG: hypothetical protein EKK63_02405 [Acinetobacter sp.]
MKLFSKISPWIIFLYITLGAGYEIFTGFLTGKVEASYPFIGFSFLIFVCRVGYALEASATKTVAVDVYGAVVMSCLLILKLCL